MTIHSRIQKIEVEAFEVASMLERQVARFICAEYTKEELNNIVFGEDDALEQAGEIEKDSLLWQEVRNLQHDIVEEYASENN